jgi:putative aldouronate transport system permease protein
MDAPIRNRASKSINKQVTSQTVSQLPWERRITPAKAAIYMVLLLIFIVTAYPFFYVLFLAVMPYDNYVQRSVHLLPSGFTTMYFEQILADRRLVQAFSTSILRTVIGTTLNVLATVMAGYALSRPRLRFGKLLGLLFLIPLFAHAGLIPAYLNLRDLRMLNTFWALILPGLVAPFYLFTVRTYFAEYPQELLEAATIDGASQFGTFWRIVVPTSTPIIATMALLYGVGHWNEYFWSSIVVQADLHPASVILQNIAANRSFLQGIGQGVQIAPQSFIAAVASVLIIPTIVIYPLLQRYVVRGILVGSLKG